MNKVGAQATARGIAFIGFLVGLIFIFTGFVLTLTVIGAIVGIPAIIIGIILVGGCGAAVFGKLG